MLDRVFATGQRATRVDLVHQVETLHGRSAEPVSAGSRWHCSPGYPVRRSDRVLSIAAFTASSSRTSTTSGKAFPPAASISSAAVKIVPSSLGCGSDVFAAMAMLAPSCAALSAIALADAREAPVTNSVLPFRTCLFLRNYRCRRVWCAKARSRLLLLMNAWNAAMVSGAVSRSAKNTDFLLHTLRQGGRVSLEEFPRQGHGLWRLCRNLLCAIQRRFIDTLRNNLVHETPGAPPFPPSAGCRDTGVRTRARVPSIAVREGSNRPRERARDRQTESG